MDRLQVEIDRNYDWFQRNLKGLLDDHNGEFAILRGQFIAGFYASPGEALRTALSEYPDRIFSIQQVVDEPLDLGFLSLAVD